MRLTFGSETHAYALDGQPVPSVTEIVAPVMNGKYSGGGSPLMEQAKRRGTLVHEYCQLIDLGCPLEDMEIEPELTGYVAAYLAFLRDYKPRWELIEHPSYSFDFGAPYAGTLDRYGTIGKSPAIVDIKTTGTMSRLHRIALCLQLGYYSRMECIPATVGMEYYGLQLKKDGTYRMYDAAEIFRKDFTGYSSIIPLAKSLIELSYLIGGYTWKTN